MANIFKNNAQQTLSERQILESKYTSARSNLLLVVLFTVINVLLPVTQSNTYFLFSAFIPFILMDYGMFYCGMYPDEVYGGVPELYVLFDGSVFAVVAVICALIVAVYLLCWIFSKKHKIGWLIAALVFFALDTVGMFLFYGVSLDAILDIIFHVWVLYYLANGIAAHYKLMKLPVEETTAVVDEPETAEPEI